MGLQTTAIVFRLLECFATPITKVAISKDGKHVSKISKKNIISG